MKVVSILLCLFFCLPAYSQNGYSGIRPYDNVVALTDCRRVPRPWKFLKLKPGHITAYYYKCIDKNGSIVLRTSIVKLDEHPDTRPLNQSHPNWEIVKRVGTGSVPFLLTFIPFIAGN